MNLNLRESYASTHHANLGWDEVYERAIDKVAASGRASALGVSLWRAKYQNEARAYRTAQRCLYSVYAGAYQSECQIVRERVANQVLREYVAEMCQTCLGIGELVEKKLRVVCGTCNGVRVKWYGDRERAAMMDLSLQRVRLLAHAIRWLAEQVEKADRQVNAVLVVQLERGT